MDGDNARLHQHVDPAKDSTADVPSRASTRREAVNLALWALVGVVFVVAYLVVGVDLWSGARSLLVFGALAALAVLFNVHRARIRTVHPRHFHLVENIAALWFGVGTGIAGQILGIAEGREVSAGVAVPAALVLTAPLFGCALWLAVRGR